MPSDLAVIASGAPEQGFSPRHRFDAQGSFGPILRAGRKTRGSHFVIHVTRRATGESRLGIALTRRLVGSSVHRNLVKRTVREAFRRHAVKRDGLDCVVTLRERFDGAQLPSMREELGRLLDALHAPGAR